MEVKVGNLPYFMFIVIAVSFYLVLYFSFRNKSSKVQDRVIIILLFVNLLIHFNKIWFSPYFEGLPYTLRKVTFENICAVSTLIYPFVYLSRKKSINNYLFFISLIGGLGALFYPTEALNKNFYSYDTIRFYYCHMTLCLVPLLLGSWKLFIPDYKKAWQIPLYFLLIEIVILINEVILIKIGWVSSSVDEFFDRNIRNSSFIFGPTKDFDNVSGFLTIVCPTFLKTNYWGLNVDQFYFPVLWAVIPTCLYMPIVYFILILPFTWQNVKTDLIRKKHKGVDYSCF